MSDLSHLRLKNTAQTVDFVSPGGGGSVELPRLTRDRLPHAHRLKNELITQAEADAEEIRTAQGLPAVATGDVIAVSSDSSYPLKIESLEKFRSGIELLSVKVDNSVTVANALCREENTFAC